MDDWYHIDTVERACEVVSAGIDWAQTHLNSTDLRGDSVIIKPVEVSVRIMVYMEKLNTFVGWIERPPRLS